MYLSELNIWNFRKYGKVAIEDKDPALKVEFEDGLNILIGENDSGKTAIIDAIRIVLGTQSNEYYFIDERDFYKNEKEFKIECVFKFKDEESMKPSKFLEWITFKDKKPLLKVRLIAKQVDGRIKRYITAGEPDLDNKFDAMEELRVTYLKPLRDADRELVAGRQSRILSILKGHQIFRKEKDNHPLVEAIENANKEISAYFSEDKNESVLKEKIEKIIEEKEKYSISEEEIKNLKNAITILEGIDNNANEGSKITNKIEEHLKGFMGEEKTKYQSKMSISNPSINSVLSSLNLTMDNSKVGLGSLNQLYMALELLLFEEDAKLSDTLNLCLIEEIEAHLHPQAQLRTIKHLQKEMEGKKGQIILTTHSITLGSSIKLENLIICKDSKAYPMGSEHTKLEKDDYNFLEMFLDATKSNLFFAKGVLLVEGDAENLLIPSFAEVIGKPLHKYGVSVVNLGNVAFERYKKIFVRSDGTDIGIPVAIVTDLDIKSSDDEFEIVKVNEDEIEKLKKLGYDDNWKYDELKEKSFLSLDSMKTYLKEQSGKKRLENGQGDSIDSIVKKKKIDLEEYRRVKREEKINAKGYNEKIRAFINKDWTLEYDLALSKLDKYLYNAIEMEKGNEIVDKNEFDERMKGKDKGEEIFIKNFYTNVEKNEKSGLSKAGVALNLSNLILENKKEVNRLIDEDLDLQDNSYLKYLVDAINHVTVGSGNDE